MVQTALIDGDILVYRIGYTTENDPEWIARARLNDMIFDMLNDLQVDSHRVFLSDSTQNGFRYHIWNEYKAHRTQPKPKHYEYIKGVLMTEWGALITPEQEADDALGIYQTDSTIICTIDKDLDQIPGWHYNFVKKQKYFVDEAQALQWFYIQLITGDKAADNIPGIYGMGEKKARKALADCDTELSMFSKVQELYQKAFGVDADALLERNGKLLKIRTREDEIWSKPQPSTTPLSESTIETEEAITQ